MSFEKKIRFFSNRSQLEEVVEAFHKEGYRFIPTQDLDNIDYFPGGIRGDASGCLNYCTKDLYLEMKDTDYSEYEFIDFDEPEEEVPVVVAVNTNPKAAIGSSKLPLHLWSPLATAYGAVGLANGAGKYGIGNYKATPVQLSIYLDATLRHLLAFIEGQEFDPVDGTPHLGAILANMAIILDARAAGTLVDDRPIAGGYHAELEKLTEIYQNLKKLHADKNPRHYTLADADIQQQVKEALYGTKQAS